MNNDELYHFSFKKPHKYIERIKKGKGFQYIYKKAEDTKKKVSNKVSENYNKAVSRFTKSKSVTKSLIEKEGSKTLSAIKKTPSFQNGKKEFDAITKKVSDVKYKYYKKINLGGKKARYFYSKEEYDAFMDKSVNKIKSMENKKVNGLFLLPVETRALEDFLECIEKSIRLNYDTIREKKQIIKETVTQEPQIIDKKFEGVLPYQEHRLSYKDDAELVNPLMKLNPEYQQNCAECTLAYDMRRRGYEVETIENKTGGTDVETVKSWYNGAEPVTLYDLYKANGQNVLKSTFADPSSDEAIGYVEDKMRSYAGNARGHLFIEWKYGGAHDVAWQTDGDKVFLVDAQSGEIHNVEDYLKRAKNIEFFRCDNLELSDDSINYVKEKKTWGYFT